MTQSAAVGVEFMIPWLSRIRRTQGRRSKGRLKPAVDGAWTRAEQRWSEVESIAGLEVVADDHDRLAHELEQAAAAHRGAARRLRARIESLATHEGAEVSELARWAAQEPLAVLNRDLFVARLLGPFEVAVRGTTIEKWGSQRAASLLKYFLLYDGGPVRREMLMAVFWPFSTSSSARNNLNVAVYSLRRTLYFVDPEHPHIIYRDGVYLLNPAVRRWVDVPEFITSCHTGHRSFEVGDLEGAITAYRHARGLYRGSLMEGDMSGEWFRDDEARLQDQHHSVLERLGTALLRQGELSQSIDVGRELVRADPC